MADQADDDNRVASGQQAFVDMVSGVFSTSADAALTAFVKLRSFMKADASVERLYQSAQMGTLSAGSDDVFEQSRNAVRRWDLGAVVRQVIMPLASGYLGYAVAGALGATGAVPALIGLLVGAIVYLCVAPGTLQMLKTRIGRTVDDIFRPAAAQ